MGFNKPLFPKEETKQKKLSTKVISQLNKLGLQKEDVGYRLAAKVLQNYDAAYPLLERLSEDSLKHNKGSIYPAIHEFGTDPVIALLLVYGEQSSEYAYDVLTVAEQVGKRTICTVSKEYGISQTAVVAPFYTELQKAKKSTIKNIDDYKITFIGDLYNERVEASSYVYARICRLPSFLTEPKPNGVLECNIAGTEPMVDVFVTAMNKKYDFSTIKKQKL